MWNQYDTMSEHLEGFLLSQFPKGKHAMGKFYINHECSIRVSNSLIIATYKSESFRRKAEKLLKHYCRKFHEHFIIVFMKKDGKHKHVATSSKAKNCLDLLLSIRNLTPTFEFKNRIFFNASYKIDIENSTISFYTNKELITEIKNVKDVLTFNLKQHKIMHEIEDIKEEILKVVRQEDARAHYSNFDILDIYCQSFVCKFQRTNTHWKIAFYKRMKPEFIFTTESLKTEREKLKELADWHVSGEKFSSLLNPKYLKFIRKQRQEQME